ncbi:MAG: chromosome segregation protein SMC [Deltaproteobacteria bacterium]|nr:chromosome segregation protein SMC [Deltaproteobacteria bacterium]
MKIKAVELYGFKSFVERIRVEFPPGITAIVGPNGCGKSNIVDAIRWVLGEQNPKQLRGKGMEDVIFAGSQGRLPLGMAEVALILSTEDGLAPPGFAAYPEIMVARRLFRSGESEYLLNKTPCRLKDLVELFLDTGVGNRSFSIVEQGKVGAILTAKPEERRSLIEEAAGIAKFKYRKKAALQKMEATKGNLVRVNDIIGEVRRQMNSLQRQAQKAEAYKALRAKMRQAELRVAFYRYQALRQALREGEAALQGARDREAALAARHAEAVQALEGLRAQHLDQEAAIRRAREELWRITSAIQAGETQVAILAQERSHLHDRETGLAREAEEAEAQRRVAAAELAGLEAQQAARIAEQEAARQQAAAAEQALEAIRGEMAKASAARETLRSSAVDLLQRLAQVNNAQAGGEQRVAELGQALDRLRAQEQALRERAAALEQEGEALAAQREALAREEGRLREALDESVRHRTALTDALRMRTEELERHRALLAEKRSRLESLEELLTRYEGYGEGVRFLMAGADEGTGGLCATVSEIFEVPSACEQAVEAVLGERLQWIVARDLGAAVDGIERLSRAGSGRATIVPLDGRLDALRWVRLDCPGARPLLTVVQVRPGYERIARYLLGGVWLVEEWREAIRLWQQGSDGLTFVTANGEVLSPGGVVAGGGAGVAQTGLLRQRREIRELQGALAELSGRLAGLEQEEARLRAGVQEAEARLDGFRTALHQAEIQRVEQAQGLARIEEERGRLAREGDVLRLEAAALEAERESCVRALSASGEARQALEAEQAAQAQEAHRLERALAELTAAEEAREQTLLECRVALAEFAQQAESQSREGERLRQSLAALEARLARIGAEREAAAARAAQAGEETAQLEAALDGQRELHGRVKAEETALEAAFAEERERLAEAERAAAALQHERQALTGEIGERQLALSEQALRLQHLEAEVRDRHQVDLTMAEGPDVAALDLEAEEAQLAAWQAELARLGEVNLVALHEFEELSQRHEFLSSQARDLQASLDGLHQVIRKINRTTRQKFQETFEAVNAQFQEIFPVLFRGGQAELRLTDGDLLEAGLEIVAQPPGKRLQNMNLLSGGEKALTAVALLFALLFIKPTPFCLLDEVDAPLDDTNIDRFNEFLIRTSKDTQFLLITHNKRTMEVADTLYGVTMEEPGISKVASVRLG